MIRLYDCINDQHDLYLILLAIVVCVLSNYTGASVAWRAASPAQARRRGWIIAAAFVTGSGTWATHFVAMLAYDPNLPVFYNFELTLLSIVLAISISGLGYAAAIAGRSPAVGGGIIGMAIAAMHYTGMSAVSIPAQFTWDWTYVAASILVGAGFGSVGLRVSLGGPERRRRIVGAGLVSLAIAGLHFTGMAALSIAPDPTAGTLGHLLPERWLAGGIAVAILAIVVLGLAGAAVDEHLMRRSAEEADRLRHKVEELEATKVKLEAARTGLLTALDAAAEADRARARFVAGMSHELRTPLNSIIGFSDMIAQERLGPVAPGTYRDYAHDIFNSGHHLLNLINDVLDLSKLEASKLELHQDWIDLAMMVHQASHMVEPQSAKAGVSVLVELTDSGAEVWVDERRMRQVLLNLLSNAIKFTPHGGKITISAEVSATTLVLSVTDTGIGMAPGDIPKALEQFGQVDGALARTHDGTGLGLPLAKGLVELHGGSLTLESAVGAGTTVTVILPQVRFANRLLAVS